MKFSKMIYGLLGNKPIQFWTPWKFCFISKNIRDNCNEGISMKLAGNAAVDRLYMQMYLIVYFNSYTQDFVTIF